MLTIIGRAVIATAVLFIPVVAAAQATTPSLDKDQRATLLALVEAVKATAADPVPEADWPVDLFRASDGSHYVAFSAPVPAVNPAVPLAVYVRLAPRTSVAAAAGGPQSAVEQWLLGLRDAPLPRSARRMVQVPSGEMPIGGAATMSSREGVASSAQSSAALGLMEFERRQAREAQEQRERERIAELEGRRRPEPDVLPFEDFDMTARATLVAGHPAIRRALTAAPGEYDLFVAWAAMDADHRPTSTGVVRRALNLPVAATGALALGSIVLADDIRSREDVFRADQQTAHPYAIGTMEIQPADDRVFTNDERLFAAFQVINAVSSPAGKPDVAVTLHLIRITPAGEQQVATLSPLRYDEASLPADFDLAAGHPILAAMAAPLAGLARGEYALAVAATDRLSRATARARAVFRIAATPQALLEAAPSFRPGFHREALLLPRTIDPLLDLVKPSATTPAFDRLMALAREGRFAELLPDPHVDADQAGAALLLQALGFYAVGDNAVAVGSYVRRGLERGGRTAVAQLLLGGSLAMDGRDDDAVAAWRAAIADGLPQAAIVVPLSEALARIGRLEEAARLINVPADGPTDPDVVHILAAADIDARREADALVRLAPFLAARDVDGELQWLALHALFSGFVRGEGPGATGPGREEFRTLARAYLDAGGRWQALAGEWLDLVTSSSPVP